MSNPQFPVGTTLKFTATVDNAEGVALPADPVTWTTDQGTGTVDPTNAQVYTVANAPFGTVTVTMTTSNPAVSVVTPVDIVDNTPASATVAVAAA